MAYKQTIATEAANDSPFSLVKNDSFLSEFNGTAQDYATVLRQEIAKITNPSFEQLSIDIQLFAGITPSGNTNGALYFQVKAQNLSSGDTLVTVGDRNGATLGTAYLPFGCCVISLQNAGTYFVDHGFNMDNQAVFDAKYNGVEKSGDNYSNTKLIVQNLEMKRNSDEGGEYVIGEFYVETDDGYSDSNSGNGSGLSNDRGTIVSITYPVLGATPPGADVNGTLPVLPGGNSLNARIAKALHSRDVDLLNAIIAAKKQMRNFFRIDDIDIDVATYPVTAKGLYVNTNEYYYAQVRARMLPDGEMQVQLRRRANHEDDSNNYGDKDNAQDGKLIADLFTPHGAAGVMLSSCNNSLSSYIVFQGNIDVQNHYDVDYNTIEKKSDYSDYYRVNGAQAMEIKTKTTSRDWVVLGELGVKFEQSQGNYNTTIFPPLLLSMYSIY